MQEFLLTFYVVIIFVAAVEITFVNSQRPLLNNSIISISNSSSGSRSGSAASSSIAGSSSKSSISSSSSSSSSTGIGTNTGTGTNGGYGINSSSFYKNKYTSDGNVLSSLFSSSSSSSSLSRKMPITTTTTTTTTSPLTSTTTKNPITLKSSLIQHYYPDEDFEDDEVDDMMMKIYKSETTTTKAVIAKPPLTPSVRSSSSSQSTSSSSSSTSLLMPIGKEQRYNQQQQTLGRRRQQQLQKQSLQKQIKSVSELSPTRLQQNLTDREEQLNKSNETIFLGSSSPYNNHRRYTSILKYLPRRPAYSNDSAIITDDGVGVSNGINDGSYNVISNLQGSAAAMISPTSQQFLRQQQQQQLSPAQQQQQQLSPAQQQQQQQQQQFQSFRPSRGRKNSINDLRKMSLQKSAPWLPNVNNNDRQSDDPAHANDKETYEDPFQALKRKVKFNSQFSMPYPSPLDTNQGSEIEEVLGVKCTFESDCAWTWEKNSTDGFHVVTGANLTESNMTGMMPGPPADSFNDANGHFIHVRLTPKTGQLKLTSPSFSTTLENCKLEMFLHQSSMAHGFFRVVIEPSGSTESSWVPAEIVGNDLRRWDLFQFRIGRISKEFRILFEIVPNNLGGKQRGHVSIDNLRMRNCFPEGAKSETCRISQVKCKTNKLAVCIEIPRICDINVDCDESEDELLNCDKIPFGGRCDFENGWCGWHNSGKAILLWSHHSGPTPTEKTGPDLDHTYQHTNITGHYMFVNMNQHANDSEKKKLVGFASNAVMNSVVFNPPPLVHSNSSSPYRNSCMVRFYVHQFGMNAGSINLSVVEMTGKENITTTLWWSSKNLGQDWIRAEIILPHITSKYFLQFEARMGMRIYSDVAVDDFSLSPECFGINIPAEHLQGYNYWDPRISIRKKPHKDFEKKGVLELTTCGSRGIRGPTQTKCTEAYNSSNVLYNSVKVIDKQPYKGMQLWKVPNEGYYTIIAKGAGGGLGSGGVGSSRGAMAIAVLELHKHEEIYILVGQSGEHACIKSIGYRDEGCDEDENSKLTLSNGFQSKTKLVKNIVIEDGAGGGGGGSFVFLLNPANVAVPLLVAGGGGGLGIGRYLDNDFQHGQGYKPNRPEVSGQVHADGGDMQKAAGPGGGWRAKADSALDPRFGAALLEGARGGLPCYSPRGYHGQGGFGGGGGGCNTGGGGGGYSGGDTYINATNGEGGTSYIGIKRSIEELSVIYEGANSGTGSVIIIPAIEGCGCDYRCIALDEFRSLTQCICPDGWKLKKDNNTACEVISAEKIPLQYLIIFFAIITILLIAALTSLILILYNRYQRKKQAALRHKMLLEQDLQLSRLRNNADDSALTNFNPNYGCDGILNGNVDVKSLPQVARESLRLVKALGQGAFGEVYQGLYRHRDGDAVEMPVAVKTLPEMSTGQAEADFLMEAAIMAKFNHPNIVHLIGVCFDRHPRFIVLELLAGGDLKNFLREGRNKPERPSPLTMRDLVFCALDVAKGCRYMESKRFIHRDIAARNCLLSSKGPGRVVKIADFGMARDIYRSDYYRKGGKAMLPIKWMPPEAFLDGIFTSKTDVWSFGVLLWEVFSLGLMPYTGLPNRDVMQLVTGGGRLDAPAGCPPAIYRIMADCWNPSPEERPAFSNLLERLTTCTQDPEVMNAPLPSIFRPPSSERDQTIMRPPGNDDFCLQIPNSSDYLIPLPGPRSAAERLINEATGVTLSESVTTCSAPTVTSPSAPCRPIDDSTTNPTSGGDCWETSFIMPNSKSDQPLLSNSNSETIPNGINGNNCGDINGLMVNHHNNSLNHRPQSNDDNETKLISLDTPQPTPTTIKPPMSFAQLDGITLDPAALVAKGQHQIPQNQAQKLSYANVQMINSTMNKVIPNDHMNKTNSTTNPIIIGSIPTEKMNGNGGGGGGNGGNGNGGGNGNNGNNGNNTGANGGGGGSSSFDGSSSTISANSAPFTIQGYHERYNVNNKDNHSEISC